LKNATCFDCMLEGYMVVALFSSYISAIRSLPLLDDYYSIGSCCVLPRLN